MKRIALSLSLSLPLLGCDDSAPECAQADSRLALYSDHASDLEFRSDPWKAYIAKWDGTKISTKQFIEAVEQCSGVQDPVWLLTLSAYTPDSAQDAQVVGLGGSATVHGKWFACMQAVWIANGAVQF